MLVVGLVAASLWMAGCGGGDSRTSSTVTNSGGTTTATVTAGDVSTSSGTSTGGGAPTATTTGDGASAGTTTDAGGDTPTGPAPGSRTKQVVKLGSGGELSYTLVLPKSYTPGPSKYPVLLALPPGGQGQAEVDALLDKWWAPEATKRGWIVVSPVAPDGQPFYSAASATLVELMDSVAAAYPPEGGRVHLAGVSTGGLSAYRIALDQPKRFLSLLVAPGFPPDDGDRAKLGRLVKIRVASYVGEEDSGWREPSVRTVKELTRLGGRASLTVSPGEGHILQKITAKQLFDTLEQARTKRA
jgi:predicted esterase